jgi:PBP1b-binding outer membrane lipoprotein LpoB
MQKYILILAGAAMIVGCEHKETTVTNPPAEKETTIIKESPAAETKTETNINVNPSPSP